MQTSFNLVQTIAVLRKKWMTILVFTIITVIVATITVYLMPQYYRSSATIVSANPVLADKARLFNGNIQNLYSYFGSGDDLDRIYGIADMDTTYKKLVDEFSLIGYYQPAGDSLPLRRRKALLQLRKDLSFRKTEQGQLQIIAWTKNKQLSADMVNRTVALIEETETNVWKQNYNRSLQKLNTSVTEMQQQYRALSDSLPAMNGGRHDLAVAQMQTLLEQIKQYRKSADEFKLANENQPAVLYVMESAVPAARAERPDKAGIIFASLLAGCIFSCVLVLLNDRKQMA